VIASEHAHIGIYRDLMIRYIEQNIQYWEEHQYLENALCILIAWQKLKHAIVEGHLI